jgi:hypothetical protein
MPARPPAPHVRQAVAAVQQKTAPRSPAPNGPRFPGPAHPGVVQRIIIPVYERSKDGSFSETQEREYKETVGGADRLAAMKERGAIRDPAGLAAQEKPLQGLAEPIYLMGHGDLDATKLGGKNAAAILAHLEALGLREYKGNRIILAGCQTASAPTGVFDRMAGTKSLVDQLKALLAAKYPKISVVGVPGFMIVDTQGVLRSVGSQHESAFDEAMADLKKKKKSQELSDVEVEKAQARIYGLYTQEIEGLPAPAERKLEQKAAAPPPPVDKKQLQIEYSRLYNQSRLKAKPGVSLADPATYRLDAQFDRFLARIDLGLITIQERKDPGHPAPAGQARHVQAATANPATPAANGSRAARMQARLAPPALQAKADPRRSRVPPAIARKVIQPMLLALGDLAEAGHAELKLSGDERQAREVISHAVERRHKATGEGRVNPWDVKGLFVGRGALHRLGRNEPLRIYGHGQGPPDSRIEAIGGYSVAALVAKLIALELPRDYTGEIYLTGCDTAVGANLGFLGEFFQQIRRHCHGVTVRGNLGPAVTLPNGEQGIWSGRLQKSAYEASRSGLVARRRNLGSEIERSKSRGSTLKRRKGAFGRQTDDLIRALDRGESVDSTATEARGRQLAAQTRQLDAHMQTLLGSLLEVDARIAALDNLAYTQALTARLPPVDERKAPQPPAVQDRKMDALPVARAAMPAPAPAESKEAQRSEYSQLFRAGRLVATAGVSLVDPANYRIEGGQFDRFLARVAARLILVQ